MKVLPPRDEHTGTIIAERAITITGRTGTVLPPVVHGHISVRLDIGGTFHLGARTSYGANEKSGEMTKQIDGKFHIEVQLEERGEGIHVEAPQIRIVKTSNGDPIPDDEPIILIRARDHLALPLLNSYRRLSIEDGCNDFHLNGVDEVLRKFSEFQRQHPERMKQPGITRGM